MCIEAVGAQRSAEWGRRRRLADCWREKRGRWGRVATVDAGEAETTFTLFDRKQRKQTGGINDVCSLEHQPDALK